jgi:hypothetical protein
VSIFWLHQNGGAMVKEPLVPKTLAVLWNLTCNFESDINLRLGQASAIQTVVDLDAARG